MITAHVVQSKQFYNQFDVFFEVNENGQPPCYVNSWAASFESAREAAEYVKNILG